MNFITTNVNFRNVNFEIDSGCCTPLRATYSSLVSFLCGDDPVDQWNITMADGNCVRRGVSAFVVTCIIYWSSL